jgi:hypothetical protein
LSQYFFGTIFSNLSAESTNVGFSFKVSLIWSWTLNSSSTLLNISFNVELLIDFILSFNSNSAVFFFDSKAVILFSTLCFHSEFKRSNETNIFKRVYILFYFCTFFLLLEYLMYTVAIPCYYILGFFEQNFWIINISLGFVLLLLTDTFSYKKFEK